MPIPAPDMKKLPLIFAFIALFAASACQTRSRIDWDSLVGTARYDDIVKRLGPPEKETTLSDGSRVGDWFLSRGQMMSNFYSLPDGRFLNGSTYRFPDRLVRLTFDREGMLKSWKRVYR